MKTCLSIKELGGARIGVILHFRRVVAGVREYGNRSRIIESLVP